MNEETKKRGTRDETPKKISSVRELKVYRLAFDAAITTFKISKNFPIEEKYSLTDQIRRSSRSVCTNLAEAWRKRRYQAMFVHKLSDAAQEAGETQTWLEFAEAHGYLEQCTFHTLDEQYEHVFAMIVAMQRKAKTFCFREEASRPSS